MPTSARKRCVLNVATGGYVPFQARLLQSLAQTGWSGATLTWTDRLPVGSPGHEQTPYGFKLFAMSEAVKQGFTSLLWLDSPCVATRALEPVFAVLEREGHCFASGGDRLGNWASDACLGAFAIPRDDAMALALMNGAFIGVDFEHARAREWYRRMVQQCDAGLFQGAALTEHAPAEIRAQSPDKSTGHLSEDPRCWGHRHDEAVGSCLAHLLGMEISPLAPLFALLPSSEAVIHCTQPDLF